MGVELDRELAGHMLDWCAHKDLLRVAQWVEPAMLGTFVKAVMRVVTYVEVLKEVLLGLGQVAAAPTLPLPPGARACPLARRPAGPTRAVTRARRSTKCTTASTTTTRPSSAAS